MKASKSTQIVTVERNVTQKEQLFSLHIKVTIITSAPWKSEVRGVCALNVALVSVDQEINTTGFCLVMHAWITIYYRRNREKISSGCKYRRKYADRREH